MNAFNKREMSKRSLIVIATEGSKCEPTYFKLFNNKNRPDTQPDVKLIPRGKGKSAPSNVLASMTRYLEKNPLASRDQAWVVVDRDKADDILRVLKNSHFLMSF